MASPLRRHMRLILVYQGSPLGPILFLLYISNMPKNILTSLVNIDADDITVCGNNTKGGDDQYLATDLSSDLILAAQWRKNWLVSLNNSKIYYM